MAMAIRDTGLYSETVANDPQRITNSITWGELMEVYISDVDLSVKHKELLNATKLDHMTFPLGPKWEDDINLSGARANSYDDDEDEEGNPIEEYVERTTMTDEEIKEMLAEVGCKVRRIVHGQTARHVYFWSADNKSRKDAIEMGYKLKGRFAPENAPQGRSGNTYNIIFSAPVQEKIKAIEAELKDILTRPPQQ